MNKKTIDVMKKALERIEADWYQIDGEWGPTEGGLEGEIERGHETLIPMLRQAIASEEAQTEEPTALPLDFMSHKMAWLTALCIARDAAEVSPPEIDDRAYWDHEIAAFQRAYAELEDGTHPAPAPSGEREALIARLQKQYDNSSEVDSELASIAGEAIDMLAADAQELEQLKEMVANWTRGYQAAYRDATEATVKGFKLEAALKQAQQVAVPQEPVAEINHYSDTGCVTWLETPFKFRQCTKLFLAATPHSPQAVPMTDAQIISEASEIDCDQAFIQGFERGARFAEAHHGIGSKP